MEHSAILKLVGRAKKEMSEKDCNAEKLIKQNTVLPVKIVMVM